MTWYWNPLKARSYNKWEGLPAESLLMEWLDNNYEIYRESGLRNKDRAVGQRTRREIVLKGIHQFFIDRGIDYISLEQIRNKIKTCEKSWKDANAMLVQEAAGLDREKAIQKLKSKILVRCPQFERLDPILNRLRAVFESTGGQYHREKSEDTAQHPSEASVDGNVLGVSQTNTQSAAPKTPTGKGKNFRWKNSLAESLLLEWMERAESCEFGTQRGMSSKGVLRDIHAYFGNHGVEEEISYKQIYTQLVYLKKRYKEARAAITEAGGSVTAREKIIKKCPLWDRLDGIFGKYADDTESAPGDVDGLPADSPLPDDGDEDITDDYITQATSFYKISAPNSLSGQSDTGQSMDSGYQENVNIRRDVLATSVCTPPPETVTLISVCKNPDDLLTNMHRRSDAGSPRPILPKGVSFPDGGLWCITCRTVTNGPCVDHSPTMTDQLYLPRAFATLPKDLIITQTADMDERGVFTKVDVHEPTVFGPLVGEVFPTPRRACAFATKMSDGSMRYYRLQSDDICNWIKYVRTADGPADENLVAFQQKERIYFVSTKPLRRGDELKVRPTVDEYVYGWKRSERHQTVPPERTGCLVIRQPISPQMYRTDGDRHDRNDMEHRLLRLDSSSAFAHHDDAMLGNNCTSYMLPQPDGHNMVPDRFGAFLPPVETPEAPRSRSRQHTFSDAATGDENVASSPRKRKSTPHKIAMDQGDSVNILRSLLAEEMNVPSSTSLSPVKPLENQVVRTSSVIVSLKQNQPSKPPAKVAETTPAKEASSKNSVAVRPYHRKSPSATRSEGRLTKIPMEEFIDEKLEAVFETNPYQHPGYHAATAAWRTAFHKLVSASVLPPDSKGVWHLKMCIRRQVEQYQERQSSAGDGCEREASTRREYLLRTIAEWHQAAQVRREALYPFPCRDCQKRFGSKRNLEKHTEIVHPAVERLYGCSDCQLTFGSNKEYRKHQTKFHRKPITHPCTVCFRIFDDTYSLHAHSEEHRVDGRFYCLLCPKKDGFPEFYFLTRHIRIFHSGQTYICDVCQKVCKTQKCLEKHSLCHMPSFAYTCDTCGRRFKRKPHFDDHMRRLHNPDRQYKMKERSEKVAKTFATAEVCQFCTRQYANEERLLIHQRMKHLELMPLELRFPRAIGRRSDELYAPVSSLELE